MDDFVQLLSDHLATWHNAGMVVGSYVLIWALEPVAKGAVDRLPKHTQVAVWGWQKMFKRFAAIIWCEILVWVPTVQPPLCDNGDESDCQTWFGRVVTGIVLGGGLSVFHRYLLGPLKRRLGIQTKEPKHVTKSRG